jgi:hypothetical protein
MSQQEEDVVSLEDSGSECFDTAEAGSGSIPVYPPFWGMDFVILLYAYLFDFSSPPP